MSCMSALALPLGILGQPGARRARPLRGRQWHKPVPNRCKAEKKRAVFLAGTDLNARNEEPFPGGGPSSGTG